MVFGYFGFFGFDGFGWFGSDGLGAIEGVGGCFVVCWFLLIQVCLSLDFSWGFGLMLAYLGCGFGGWAAYLVWALVLACAIVLWIIVV